MRGVVSAWSSFWALDTTDTTASEDGMAEPFTVALTGVRGDQWFTGSVKRWVPGERRTTCETRPVMCRIEDAGDELAELIAWALKPQRFEPQLGL